MLHFSIQGVIHFCRGRVLPQCLWLLTDHLNWSHNFFLSLNTWPLWVIVCAESLQSCLTLCDPMDCNLPGSSDHGILQQEYWSVLPFLPPRDLPDLGIKPPCLMSPAPAGRFFTTSTTGVASFQSCYIIVSQGTGRLGEWEKNSRPVEQSEHTPLVSSPSYVNSSCGSSAISMGTSKITDHRSPQQISQ